MLPSRGRTRQTKGCMCRGIQRTSTCCHDGGSEALGPSPGIRSAHPSPPPPRSAADAWLQELLGAGSFSCSPLLSPERKKIQGSWGQKGDQNCVCARVSVYLFMYICIYKYICIRIQTHTRVYTHTCKMTPALSGWDRTWEGEPCPLIPCVMDHYGGFVSGVSFMKQITGWGKISANRSVLWRPWLVKRQAAKGLGILWLHFWAGMPNVCVSPSSGWKPACEAGALGLLQSQWSHSVDSSELWIKSVSMLEMYCPAGVLCKEKHK